MSLLDSSEPTARQGFFVSFPAIPLVRSVILSPLCVILTIPLCKNQKIVSMSVANSRSEGSVQQRSLYQVDVLRSFVAKAPQDDKGMRHPERSEGTR